MEFGIKKYGVLILKRGKVVKSAGIKLPGGKVMTDIDEEGYKYLGILESDKTKEEEMKSLFVKEYKITLNLKLIRHQTPHYVDYVALNQRQFLTLSVNAKL